MKILVVGANTVTGRHVIKYIHQSRIHQARAMLHNSVQVAYFQQMEVETVLIEQSSKPKIKELTLAAKNIDAIVLIGSFYEGEKEPFIRIDEIMRILEVFKNAGVNRFVHMSTFDSNRSNWNKLPEFFRFNLIENYYIDQWLKSSNVAFTIIHPGTLNDQQSTGLITIDENEIKNKEISREDVAKVIFSCLQKDITIGKEFKLTSGKITIEEAISIFN